MLRSSNPILSEKVFSSRWAQSSNQVMTLGGTVNKCWLMLVLVLLSASYTWGLYFTAGQVAAVQAWTFGGMIVGLIAGLVTIFKRTAAPISAPIYAIAQGFFLGGISSIFEAQYPGIVFQSIILTFGTLFSLLFAYKSRIIQVTDSFRLGVMSATGGLAIVYGLSIILGLFGIQLPFIFSNGLFGIGFSVFVVTIAALNLVMDFDFIEKAAQSQQAKYMEWVAAFGLMATLIWLYVEILRLLTKLRSRD